MNAAASGRSTRTLAIATLAIVLAGCCTNVSTDPHRGGLAGGACGLSSGAYAGRLAQRRDTLASLDSDRQSLERDLAHAQSTADALAARIAETSRRAAARRAALDAENAEIARLRARKTGDEAELAALEAENRQLGVELATHMQRARDTELAAQALRGGALAAASQRSLDEADARNRSDGEDIDRRIADVHSKLLPLSDN